MLGFSDTYTVPVLRVSFVARRPTNVIYAQTPTPVGGRRLAIRDLTVKERILLHLYDYNRYAEEYEAPLEVTQSGIAEAVGIRVSHVTTYVKPLVSEGLVEEKVSRIKRKPRRRKTYFLTPRGKNQSASLRGSLLEESAPFRTRRGEISELMLSQIYQSERRGATLIDLLEEQRTLGHITESRRPAASGLVELLEEAPVVEEFYGRQRESEEILRSLDRAPIVIITGMAGVGKSTLAAKVCESLSGKRSLFWRSIRAWDSPADIARRLAAFLRQVGRGELYSYLSGPGEREASRIEDLLASDLADVPCLLVLDDVQNASDETQAFLALLARVLYLQRGAGALVLSRRTPEFYSRREVMLEEGVAEMTLGGLDPESSRTLLREAGYRSEKLSEMVKTSAGMPLFLKLIARSEEQGLGDAGWDALEDYIAEEIEPGLNEAERGFLETASFYSAPVPEAALLQGEKTSRRTMLDLRRRGLLERSETERFALHDFLRDYFQRNLSPERRTAVVDAVVPWLQEEAEIARNGGRPQDAISYVENAIVIETEPPRRIRSLELLGRARRAAGDDLGSIEAFRSALQEVDRDEDRARLHWKVAIPLFNLRRLEESEEEIERGLKLVPSNPNLDLAWLLTMRAQVAYVKADFRRSSRDLTTVLSWMPELPEDLELKLWAAQLEALVNARYPMPKELSETRDDWRRVLESARASTENPNDLFFPLLHFTLGTLESGETGEAMELLGRTEELGEAAGRSDFHALALLVKAWYLLEVRGDYEAAEVLMERSFAMFRESTATFRIPWFYRLFADLYWRQGRLEEARESLAHFLRITPLSTGSRIENLSRMVRLCVESGEADMAKTYLQEATDLESRNPPSASTYFLEWARALVGAQQGEPERADSHFRRAASLEVPLFTGAGNLVELLACTRSPGELLIDFGRFLITQDRLHRAEEVLTQAQAEFRNRNRKPQEREIEFLFETTRSPDAPRKPAA